jgi:hypothetical protein
MLFDRMSLEADAGRTAIVGEVVDSAHLQGLVDRAAGLGLALVSANPQTGLGDEARGGA